MARLLSMNVGLPSEVAWNGKTVRTAVWKFPIEGRRMVRTLNIDGTPRLIWLVMVESNARYSSTRWIPTVTGNAF